MVLEKEGINKYQERGYEKVFIVLRILKIPPLSSCACVKINGPAKREKLRVQSTCVRMHWENLRVLPLSDQILSVLPASSQIFFKRSQSVHLLKRLVGEIIVACCNTVGSCDFCFVSAVSFSFSPHFPFTYTVCLWHVF